jgi:hypothetical protein
MILPPELKLQTSLAGVEEKPRESLARQPSAAHLQCLCENPWSTNIPTLCPNPLPELPSIAA